MPLSIFADALPYSEIKDNYSNWFKDQQVAPLLPNIAYSSSLHWQLYCNKYPDERGVLVDWCMEKEKSTSIRIISRLLGFMDSTGDLGIILKKILSKYVYRKNAFANIPFRFRPQFSEKGKYLFWNKETYSKESIFDGYTIISQDEGHVPYDAVLDKLHTVIDSGHKNIFFNTGFADCIGHVNERGLCYSRTLAPEMEKLHKEIAFYLQQNPNEEVMIISDHGMSTVKNRVDFNLEEKFGKQSDKTYIAYKDSCIMCIWIFDRKLKENISHYLQTRTEGHLLTDEERIYYKAENLKFGDLIYILKEGTCFSNNWFGKSYKKPSPNGSGMHGFWPEWEAYDQLASVILINSKRQIKDRYIYQEVHELIKEVMR